MKMAYRPLLLNWVLYAALLAAMPAVRADPVQLICDDSGPVMLDYANSQVTFRDRTYPMQVTDKSVTW